MPFFDDADGNNPFDYLLQIHSRPEGEDNKNRASINIYLIEELLREYKDHEFMSLGRSISRIIPEAIYKNVQSVAEFMKARLFLSE
jgi:hypothetical protein